jgi:MinD superfamily P-loop ATPase
MKRVPETAINVAIASGKGGTGKTMVATSLAWTASSEGMEVHYLDCDVEEPNGHIFLKPELESRRQVTSPVPVVDESSCIHCGRCGEICRFSAIVSLGNSVITFPGLCHGCGGCSLVCPVGAITETGREIGLLESGRAGGIGFTRGTLNIGEVRSPALIREVKSSAGSSGLVIVDSPPGTSCPVVEAVRGADYVVLVTEPTPFGLSDLALAREMVETLCIPYGIVLNRSDICEGGASRIPDRGKVEILAEIPFDRKIAETCSSGGIVSGAMPGYRDVFRDLLAGIRRECAE